jgi:hypothetical protein
MHVCTSFVSDVEGNYEYWRNFLRISYVVRQEDDEEAKECDEPTSTATPTSAALPMVPSGRRLVLRDNCHLVYGGDVCDRGAGDLRVIRDIVALKERYPDRVHVILGNRDINKLRLPFELCEHTRMQSGKVYWIRGAKVPDNCSAATKLTWVGADHTSFCLSMRFPYRRVICLFVASDILCNSSIDL